MPFIPHTDTETREILTEIGVSHINELFDEIPNSVIASNLQNIPQGLNEYQMLELAETLAGKNTNHIHFIGAGAYEHHIPVAVWDIASRGEFLTAYTPYQAEASQGSLQILYEFQTMIAELTGMEVANASLYDGASALAEAILMSVRLQKNKEPSRVLITGALHPYYKETVLSIVSQQNIEVIMLPIDEKMGITNLNSLDYNDFSALVICQPNFFGSLEEVDELTNWAKAKGALVIACVNPISLGLLKPPSAWGNDGADIVCGEGQSLGVPLASGGPYFGFFSTKLEYVRQMPGRVAGLTYDRAGNPGFTLTLQAREQHIRRSKANSNICTNQGLVVTAATIHMALLGVEGLKQVALKSYQNTHDLVRGLCSIPGVKLAFCTPFFHEALLKFDYPVGDIVEFLKEHNIEGGFQPGLFFNQFHNTLLVCATEVRSAQEIALYQQCLARFMEQK